jgi:cytochrome c peroxidase
LAARAPFFHNGIAANLEQAVNFYNQRFQIGLSQQQMQDLVNLLQTL